MRNNLLFNKTVDILFNAHQEFSLLPSFGNGKRLEHQIIQIILEIRLIAYTCNAPVRFHLWARGRRGCDRMVVGFSATCAISSYHH